MATRTQRKIQIAWFGDKETKLGQIWMYRKQKPEVFGYAKGLVMNLTTVPFSILP